MRSAWGFSTYMAFAGLLALSAAPAAGQVTPGAEAIQWQTLTLDFAGPASKEMGDAPNPFLDYRLQVLFNAPNGRKYDVPGYYDGDGKGGGDGALWRVRFTPDQAGAWTWKAAFRSGRNVAVDTLATAGAPAGFDGAAGAFTVKPRDPGAPGFAKWGRLEWVGKTHLKFAQGGYFLKSGADEPENMLAYAGFDNTRAGSYGIHTFSAHARDWETGDPDWGGGKGKGVIGALNYLASQRINSIYFLTMNIGGDGRDVWPFAGPIVNQSGSAGNDNTHYDISKLAQWETVFAHAQAKGILLHVVLNEAEEANKRELDDGELGVERKLYYRELIARFAHHNALVWNLCEEYNLDFNLGAARIKSFAAYIKRIDPYRHPLTVHSQGDVVDAWSPFFGDPNFDLMSVQYNSAAYEGLAETLRKRAADAGRPLAIGFDEFDRLSKVDDESRASGWPNLSGWSGLRKRLVWPAVLSGAQFEFITEDLLRTENYRLYEGMWEYAWYARKFMEENLPFADMVPADPLLTGIPGEVLALPGKIYAVYLPKVSAPAQLDLTGAPGRFEAKWYDPRAGVFAGPPVGLAGGGKAALPTPPASPDQDWALVVRHESYTVPTFIHTHAPTRARGAVPAGGRDSRRWLWPDESGNLRDLSGQLRHLGSGRKPRKATAW